MPPLPPVLAVRLAFLLNGDPFHDRYQFNLEVGACERQHPITSDYQQVR